MNNCFSKPFLEAFDWFVLHIFLKTAVYCYLLIDLYVAHCAYSVMLKTDLPDEQQQIE